MRVSSALSMLYAASDSKLPILLRTGAAVNRVSYSNPKFDALCDQADRETNTDKRLALYQQADRLAMSEAPLLPLVYPVAAEIVKPYEKDRATNLMGSLAHRKTFIKR